MSKSARIPKIDRANPRLQEVARLMSELADERSGPFAGYEARSNAIRAVAEDVLRKLAHRRDKENNFDD